MTVDPAQTATLTERLTEAGIEAVHTTEREYDVALSTGPWDFDYEQVLRKNLAASVVPLVTEQIDAERERLLDIVAPHQPEENCGFCDDTRALIARAGGPR